MSSPEIHPGKDASAFLQTLMGRSFSVRDGQFCVESVPVAELAERYGTPLFAYSRSALDDACAALRRTLPAGMEFYYSVKANPTLGIVRQILKQADGLEIASIGEWETATRAGCPPERILFAGPGKSDAELQLAADGRVGELHVESIGEIRRLERIAGTRGRRVSISIRVNPDASVQGGGMRMGGRATAFGIEEPQLPEALAEIQRAAHLDLVGLHLFAGTQILDAAILVEQYRHALQMARRVAEQIGRPLRRIDFGGGWGVPLFPHDAPLDLDRLKPELAKLRTEADSDRWLSDTRWMIEPGRFLVAAAGLYIARVLDVKRSFGTTFIVLDGGMNHHLAASGNLGQTIKRNFPIAVLNRMNEPAVEPVEVVGPLCTPLDTLARKLWLPRIHEGDLIGVFQSGAYARSASPLGFLSHATPPETLVSNSEHRVIRRRSGPEDAFRDQEASAPW